MALARFDFVSQGVIHLSTGPAVGMNTLLLVTLLAQPSLYVRTQVGPGVCAAWAAERVITVGQNDVGLGQRAGAEYEAVTKALTKWQDQLAVCASVRLAEGPRTASRQVGYDVSGPNENVVLYRTRFCADVVPSSASCWSSMSCESAYDCFDGSRAAVALATVTVPDRASGEIVDADIEFNASRDAAGRGYVLTTVDMPACPAGVGRPDCISSDIQATATHEFGHVLGLDHTGASGSTMRATADLGSIDLRSIDPGTASFACQVYGKGRPPSQCTVSRPVANLGPARGCSVSPALGLLALLGLRRRLRM
jgi:hypothetical protein